MGDVGARDPDLVPAGAWRRFGAYFFDSLLTTLLVAATFYAWFGFDVTLASYLRGPDDLDARLRFIAERSAIRNVSLLLYLAYATLAEASPMGGTLGKWLLSMRVVTADGAPIDLRRAILRNGGKLISLLTLIGLVVALRSPLRQTWHDRWAQTVVVFRRVG